MTNLSSESSEQFLEHAAFMAHDLSAPLSSLVGYSQILLDEVSGPLNDDQKEWVQFIQNKAISTSKYLFQTLSLARIESDDLHLQKETLDIVALIEDIVEKFQDKLDKKSQSLELIFLDNSPFVIAHSREIREVFQELIENAHIYSPENSTISISNGIQSSEMKISITDSGNGVSPGELEYIFHKFYRKHDHKKTDQQGFGLGLYIAKNFVEQFGGNIGVESKEGQGSTFWLTLPIADEPPEQE